MAFVLSTHLRSTRCAHARMAGVLLASCWLLFSAPTAACDSSHLGSCAIDLFQGPVLAPSRVTGLGGAFAAYAEGVDAIASNAASVAVRPPYSFSWFDYDLTLGISFPAAFRGTDFDNDGAIGFTYNDFLFYTLGAQVQLGPWGLGVLSDFQSYDLLPTQKSSDPQVTEMLGRMHVVLGRSFLDGQLSIGGGLRAVTLIIDSTLSGGSARQVATDGLAPEIGVLVRPDYLPWRLGATLRAAVDGRSNGDTSSVASGQPFVQPASILLPWELELGAAIQVGPRPFNPSWLDPHAQEARLRSQIEEDRALRRIAQDAELATIDEPKRMFERARELSYGESFVRREEDQRLDDAKQTLLLERKARYANWPRERITVLMDLLITGKSSNAIGLESFFSEQATQGNSADFKRSGEHISYSPRLGLEGEPLPDRIQTRIGTYIEPSRFGGLARQHFTFGFDVKLFAWSAFGLAGDQIWRVGGVCDLAPRYQSLGLSIGAWH